MNEFKPGDIVRQRIHPGGRWDYFHVEYAHRNGALDCIADADGKPCGLSAHARGIEKATLAQLVEHREAV
ncbi:hypothetical protein SAMN05428966_102133 [Massilia sp. PDC64]|nr:hypothetical protein [Massilia sp. PDC64]SDC69557.1 hypothetical protein SAMN05428966_102133 [Massilia sp. PDC64]